MADEKKIVRLRHAVYGVEITTTEDVAAGLEANTYVPADAPEGDKPALPKSQPKRPATKTDSE